MNENRRSDPDKLLKQLQEEEVTARRGKLRIFLGAAPGVGKTYAMLKDAIEKKNHGMDVVIGIIESHGRDDIIALMDSLEKLPLQSINYHGKKISEFALDSALTRHPQLLLIDEMAHTNVPGLRHTKRWQDIRELLDSQVNVYTTLNVQHIESLNDKVSGIVHTSIRETVPDFMLDMADSIELVDLPTEDLLKRLNEGKIYIPERAKVAAKHFFLPGNLIALREMALRYTAQRVGKQVQHYRQEKGIRHVWSTHEKIMICVGPGIESMQLIRRGKQMASSFQCSWVAVHVNAADSPETEQEHSAAVQHLRLAGQLGAETADLNGTGVAETLTQYAREQNISLILVWKNPRSRIMEFLRPGLASILSRHSSEIDIYIITDQPDQPRLPPAPVRWFKNLRIYAASVFLITAATVAGYFLGNQMSIAGQFILYLLAVAFALRYGSFFSAIFSMMLAIAAFHIFLSPFPLQSGLQRAVYLISLFSLMAVSLTIGYLMMIARRQTLSAHIAAWQAGILHRLGRQLAMARNERTIIADSERFLSEVMNSEVSFTITAGMQTPAVPHADAENSEKEAIMWVSRMGQMAGLGTDTLPDRKALYLPMSTGQEILGVMRVQPLQPHLFPPEQVRLLETCVVQTALAIELNRLKEESYQASLRMALEHDRMVFMQSVAADLQTPLTNILTYAKIIETPSILNDKDNIITTAEAIFHEAGKIRLLTENLLQFAWLDQGFVQPAPVVVFPAEIIRSIIAEHFQNEAEFILDVPDNLPGVMADMDMLRMVLLNLLDNAVRFSPPKEPIRIEIRQKKNLQSLCIENAGPPIPKHELESIFQKYYQSGSVKEKKGLGLGLAICRKIIQTHGGEIWAENRRKKGVAFCFTLPSAGIDTTPSDKLITD